MIHTLRSAAGLLALAASLLGATAASAQVSQDIDRSRLETWRLQSGDQIRFCHYDAVPTAPFDRAVADEIASRLLLGSTVTAIGANYAIGGEYAAEDLFVLLTNDCDVMLGLGLAANAYPQEFTVTRPYAGFPYVLVVDDEEIETLSDIPGDRRLGAPVGSYGLREVIRYTATRPSNQRWQTLPYGDSELMLTRLRDDTIAGMIVYGPSLLDLIGPDPEAENLTVRSLEPELQVRIETGGVLLTRNSFLRELIDDAITAMVEDGTIERLIAEAGFGAFSSVPGGYSD